LITMGKSVLLFLTIVISLPKYKNVSLNLIILTSYILSLFLSFTAKAIMCKLLISKYEITNLFQNIKVEVLKLLAFMTKEIVRNFQTS